MNIEEIGFDLDFLNKPDEDDNIYTAKIEAPIYQITGKKPAVKDLYNTDKSMVLIDEIKAKKLPKAIEEFLIASAYRHTIFNYSQIAEYYAHETKDVQDLFEKSCLIIIDYNKAIEQGFAKLVSATKEDLDD